MEHFFAGFLRRSRFAGGFARKIKFLTVRSIKTSIYARVQYMLRLPFRLPMNAELKIDNREK
jgi:hypothetical protein